MRIICLSRIVMAHGTRGGMETHLQLLAEGLAVRGHTLHVVTTGLHNRAVVTTENGVTYHFLPTQSGKYRPKFFHLTRQFVRDHAADVVWGQGWAGEGVATLRQRPPLVSILHGTAHGELQTRLRQWRSPNHALRIPLMAWRHLRWRNHLTRAACLIAVSDEVANDVATIPNAAPTTVVVNGIDVERFQSGDGVSIRTRYGIPPDVKLLVGIGRMSFEKGFQLAINAAEQLPNTHLLLVGAGDDRAALQQMATQSTARGRISFTGYLPNQQLPDVLAAADLCLLPTLRNEGLPITLLEAMASGTPIVATNVGGIAAAVTDGQDSLLFPMGDVEMMVRQIERGLGAEGENIGRNAQQKAAAQFSVQQMIVKTEAILQAVSGGKS